MRPVQSYADSSTPLAAPLAAANPTPKRASSTRSRKTSSSTTTTTAVSSLTEPQLQKRRSSILRAEATTPQPHSQSPQQTLHPRDANHHVLSLTPATRSATRNASSMPPIDKSRQSQLGASTAKSSTRSPLTPKVAVKAPHAQHAGTPLVKSNKEDPSVAYTNIAAARSGPRQNRGNSASTTPSGTPRLDRAGDLLWDNSSSRSTTGMPPLVRSESQTSSRQATTDSSSDQRSDSSKFFYASEVKPQPSFSRPGSVQQKAPPTFFYASEAPPSAKRSSNPPANPVNPPPLTTTSEGVASKFFYANGAPELSTPSHSRPPLSALPSSGSGSSASTTSRMVPVRPSTGNSAAGHGAAGQPRPDSPPKASSANASHSSRSSIIMPNSPSRNQGYSTPSIATATTPSRRRVSIDAPPKVAIGHSRTGSVPGMDAFNATKFIMPTVMPTVSPSELASSPLAPSSTPTISMASLLQTADELDDEEDEEDNDDDDDDDGDGGSDDDNSNEDGEEDSEDDDSDDDSYSPSKSPRNSASDYVLSARRERKVQDLEIRNTSLEAINKTLERQLRKQTAELRRFRRLSRAGKIPTESSVPNSRATSVQPSELSDLSEEESAAAKANGKSRKEEDDEEDEKDSFSSDGSSSTESDSGSQSDNSDRRKRDERRLQLDLAKHQELLQDSQKMNQSLKRCLNWTEELIKEGQKALAHQVRVSDVQFGYGGRVLSPPDEDDDDTSHRTDETLTNVDSVDSDAESAANPWDKGPQDRDSGIELPVDSG